MRESRHYTAPVFLSSDFKINSFIHRFQITFPKPTEVTMASSKPQHPSKKLIEDSYDSMAPSYQEWTSSTPSPREHYTEKLISLLPSSPRPKILELGCGAGIPSTQYLAQHADVTGNDISSVQLALAKKNAPSATLIHSDMMSLSFPPNSLDAVIALYSIIHLPREEQAELFKKMYGWVKEGGYFVGTLSTVDKEEIQGGFLGQGMFWSSWDEITNRKMVEGAGWKIVEGEVIALLEKGTDGREDRNVPFLWIVGRKEAPSDAGEEKTDN